MRGLNFSWNYRSYKGSKYLNPDKKIKLATYASRCIENEILMYLRRNSKIKAEISFMSH